jgi:hypothetical protein
MEPLKQHLFPQESLLIRISQSVSSPARPVGSILPALSEIQRTQSEVHTFRGDLIGSTDLQYVNLGSESSASVFTYYSAEECKTGFLRSVMVSTARSDLISRTSVNFKNRATVRSISSSSSQCTAGQSWSAALAFWNYNTSSSGDRMTFNLPKM